MKKFIPLEGMSQFSPEVYPSYQNSACGPTTIFVMLKFMFGKHVAQNVNILYRMLGTTKIGLFRWRLIKNLQNYLGTDWVVKNCSLKEAMKQIDEGRPVAIKFDKYFTLQWKSKPTFTYHWVPFIGYEIEQNELLLIVHDHGGINRDSQIRKVPYSQNYKVISFVKIEPRKKK
ncbi:C39 family peptidase [Ureibacillus sp. FSL W8-0352]|uniref:C39 family peptidase n=1 Tax=Ureibacillus sp. FSL W8-0352 TaxID=2954596 RepID=UPI0030FB8CF3